MFGYRLTKPATIWVAVVIALSAGCGGDSPVDGGGTGGTPPTQQTLFGTVLDEAGQPIEGVAVTVNGVATTTDGDGEFLIVTGDGKTIATFEHELYLPTLRNVAIAQSSPTAAHVQLKSKSLAQSMSADVGGTVAGERQAAVTIEPGDLSGPNGSSVTGMVEVSVTPVDPSLRAEVQALAGSFETRDRLLESFGLVYLSASQGRDRLEIAPGESLEVRIPIPSGATPGTLRDMPLWRLDRQTGRWVEDGMLEFDEETDTFVGQVTELAAWNADILATATCITGLSVDDEVGDPIAGAEVDATGEDYFGSSTATTGENGRFYIVVRKSSQVSVTVTHAAEGGETREVTSGEGDTTIPATAGDSRCSDVGSFTIRRAPPPPCAAVDCGDAGDDCTVGRCDDQTLDCVETDLEDGRPCNEGAGQCEAGECIVDPSCEGVSCLSDNECVQDGMCNAKDGQCIPGANVPEGNECSSSGGNLCDGDGNCVECTDESQCPDDGNECTVRACEANQCESNDAVNGTPCDYMGGPGICADGMCVEPPSCVVAGDCEDDGNECTIEDCVSEMCSYDPDEGTTCEVEPGLPGLCDDTGACIPLCVGVDCTSDTVCRADGTCDDQNGECILGDPVADGTVCQGVGMCAGGECILEPTSCPGGAVFCEDFESGIDGWSADRGLWDVGTPTVGPVGCNSGSQCAGTVLDGNYPPNTDSRFVSPTMLLPSVSGIEEVHLRFYNWFSYRPDDASFDFGQVQVLVRAPDGTFGDPVSVGTVVSESSTVWTVKDVDLTAYAGEIVRIAFLHNSRSGNRAGWYIDDIAIVAKEPTFTGDFEAGWGDWGADRGLWQIGTPTDDTVSCFSGSQCAVTVLDGDYPASTDSRLVSATVQLPSVSGIEEVHLRFYNWFSYRPDDASFDFGQVQVSVRAPDGTFGAWTDVGNKVTEQSTVWTLKDVDLTAYEGEIVRIAFLHNSRSGNRAGWYIDDIAIVAKEPTFTGDFEAGWGDWGADRGLWQIGTPTDGTVSCFSGSQCAVTVLDANYPPSTDSRLVSATVQLPSVSGIEEVHLRFYNWFSYRPDDASFDFGQVQVSVQAPDGTFGAWTDVGNKVTEQSTVWTLKDVDLTAYEGEIVRIAFFHNSRSGDRAGWYIDDIEITP